MPVPPVHDRPAPLRDGETVLWYGRMKYAVRISPMADSALVAGQFVCAKAAGGQGDPRLTSAATGRPVQPSQAQSCLVVPSPTLNFPGCPVIRAHSRAFVATSICVHLCVSVAQAQYGLIRPNTALNFPENPAGWSNLANFTAPTGGWRGQKKGLPSPAVTPYSSTAFSSDVPQQASRRQEIKSH
jgi:hypothetical protein